MPSENDVKSILGLLVMLIIFPSKSEIINCELLPKFLTKSTDINCDAVLAQMSINVNPLSVIVPPAALFLVIVIGLDKSKQPENSEIF